MTVTYIQVLAKYLFRLLLGKIEKLLRAIIVPVAMVSPSSRGRPMVNLDKIARAVLLIEDIIRSCQSKELTKATRPPNKVTIT